MTIRGGGHPKPTMVLTPFLRMGPPPRSFAADAHDCIMVRPPLDLPNTRLWRDDPRPMASSPLIVNAPNRFEKSGRDFSSGSPGQGPLVATTSTLGRRDAGRKGATMPPPAQPWSGPKPCRLKPLDTRCPIQGLLRLHSRYGLSDRSIAQGDLCHEASARRVAPPDRSSATSSTDNSLGGTFLHW